MPINRSFVAESALASVMAKNAGVDQPWSNYGGMPASAMEALMASPRLRSLLRPRDEVVAENQLIIEAVLRSAKLVVNRIWGAEKLVEEPPVGASAEARTVYLQAVEKERRRASEFRSLVCEIEAVAEPIFKLAANKWTD